MSYLDIVSALKTWNEARWLCTPDTTNVGWLNGSYMDSAREALWVPSHPSSLGGVFYACDRNGAVQRSWGPPVAVGAAGAGNLVGITAPGRPFVVRKSDGTSAGYLFWGGTSGAGAPWPAYTTTSLTDVNTWTQVAGFTGRSIRGCWQGGAGQDVMFLLDNQTVWKIPASTFPAGLVSVGSTALIYSGVAYPGGYWVDPANTNIHYIYGTNPAATSHVLLRSVDSGVTWAATSLTVATSSWRLQKLCRIGNKLYAVAHGYVYSSTDNGVSWGADVTLTSTTLGHDCVIVVGSIIMVATRSPAATQPGTGARISLLETSPTGTGRLHPNIYLEMPDTIATAGHGLFVGNSGGQLHMFATNYNDISKSTSWKSGRFGPDIASNANVTLT